MEGKKALWVVFSIALVLVVILAGGLFLLRPRQAKPVEAAAPAPRPSIQGYDPYEYVRGASEPPGLAPTPAEPQPSLIVVGEKPGSASGAPAPSEPLETAPPPPKSALALQPQPLVASVPAKAEPRPAVKPAADLAVPAARPAAKAAAKPAARVVAKAAAKPAPKPKAARVTEYWIQAGSFSSASRADEVTRSLEERGLAARTSTRDLNGKTHFRVRIGPYSSKEEAEKFLAWVRALKGFESSYISMVASRRAMP
jgi:DedD protein